MDLKKVKEFVSTKTMFIIKAISDMEKDRVWEHCLLMIKPSIEAFGRRGIFKVKAFCICFREKYKHIRDSSIKVNWKAMAA